MTTRFYLSPHSGLRYMDRLVVACPHTWPATKGCHSWGAVGPHGCKFLPGHEGRHVCACGRREARYPSITGETQP